MKTTGTLALMLFVGALVWAGENAMRVPWSPAKDHPRVKITKQNDREILDVRGDAQMTTTTIVDLKNPKVPSHKYVLRGRIKYEDVQGKGHLEMWSTFPKRGSFFTKTLAATGPMGVLSGTSDWRDLELPFTSEPGLLPEKIAVHVVLPGRGTVTLEPLTIAEWK